MDLKQIPNGVIYVDELCLGDIGGIIRKMIADQLDTAEIDRYLEF